MKRAFVVWIACVSLACYSMVTKATVPIPGARTVLAPPGVTLQAVEVGVLAGINQAGPPPGYDPYHELPEAEFQALIAHAYLDNARWGGWFPEWRAGDVRYASVDNWQEYHLLVGVHLDTDQVRIEYIESRNMDEHAGRVNDRARAWMDNLAFRINQAFIQIARAPKPSS